MTEGIVFDGVTHAYGNRPVLRDITLTLTEHRIGVLGANGSGKSTLARMINGLVVPDRGTVRVDGLDTRRATRKVRRRVGFVFTDPDRQILMPTVAEDIELSLSRHGLSRDERADRTRRVLERFGLAGTPTTPRICCRVVRNNCWRWPPSWSPNRASWWPTNRPRCSTFATPRCCAPPSPPWRRS